MQMMDGEEVDGWMDGSMDIWVDECLLETPCLWAMHALNVR